MKQFNLLKEIIVVNKNALLKAINANQAFGINYKGEIITDINSNEIYIFQGKLSLPSPSALMPHKQAPSIEQLFSNNYKVVEDDDRVLIKAGGNWQELIKINVPNADYDDTTGDGVAEFRDKAMENMGWHATEFDIKYREIIEQLEANVSGVLFCIENEEPYQFSGMGFFENIEETREFTYNYCRNIIKEKLENDEDFNPETLSDDEEEAARFFQLLE